MDKFLKWDKYTQLLENKDQENTANNAIALLQEFLLNLSSLNLEYQPTRDQQKILAQLLNNNPDQVKKWFIALQQATTTCEEKINFVYTEDHTIIKGELQKIKKVCPYDTDSGRAHPDLEFGDGLQQMLQAKKQLGPPKDPAFLIQQESKVILSSNNNSVLNRPWACIVGTTATAGSEQELAHLQSRLPVRIPIMPSHQDKKRIDHPAAQPCNGDEEHKKAVKQQIKDCLEKDSHAPILMVCAHARQVEEFKLLVDEVLQEFKGYEVQTLTGTETYEVERATTKKAGHAKTITIASTFAGRGFDVMLQKLEEKQSKTAGLRTLIVTPPSGRGVKKRNIVAALVVVTILARLTAL